MLGPASASLFILRYPSEEGILRTAFAQISRYLAIRRRATYVHSRGQPL